VDVNPRRVAGCSALAGDTFFGDYSVTITAGLKQEALSQESDLPLVLLEIDHADLSHPILVVNNKTNITSNGDEYVAFPFEIILPDSKDDAQPRAKLRIDNVSREIGEAIRSISSPPSVTIKIVRQDTPNTVEMQFSNMQLSKVSYDALSVEGDIDFEDLTREPFPAWTFSPSYFSGIL
jgi:hypothetical protein